MSLIKKIIEKLNGLHFKQEYLCFAAETFEQPLHAYLVHKRKIVKDITTLHAFAGYCPLIFVLSASDNINEMETIEVAFTSASFAVNDRLSRNRTIALIRLTLVKRQKIDDSEFFYYQGIKGHHHFTTAFHQSVGRIHNNLYNKRPGNVFLKGNLYQQVQIAYALPRKIGLITVGMQDAYNLFPTDLHGKLSGGFYVISLRHSGKACDQVMTAQRIVLSEVKFSSYRDTYWLGKNHMQPLKERRAFGFSDKISANFQLPLAREVLSYRELVLRDSFDVGIHKLMLFSILWEEKIADSPETLAHIHNVYATWRHKKGLPGNYLLR